MAALNSPKKRASKRSLGDDTLQSRTTMNEPSTSAEETQVSHNDSAASKNYQIQKLEVGDIVWAKIGKFPFWPSMVCKDPDTNTLTKGSPNEKRKFSLHVRFCYDHGRRSWAKNLEIYEGKDILLSKYPNSLVFIKNSKKLTEMWNSAVKEADYWLTYEKKEDRWEKFARRHDLKPPKNSPCKSSSANQNSANQNSANQNSTNQNSANQSSSASLSNSSLNGTTAITKNTGRSIQNVSKKRPGEPLEEALKKKLAPKRKYQRRIKKVILDASLKKPVPEENYHIDAVVNIPPTTEKMVDERMKTDLETLEADGIRKIKEWKALKTAGTISQFLMNGKKKN